MSQGVDLRGEVKRKRAEAKASLKGRQSRGSDTKPDDLVLSRMKFFERRMEVRTSATCTCLDDLGLGVKSLSNLAMACSCRSMPQYSLPVFESEVKHGLSLQSLLATGLLSNSELVLYIQEEWGPVRKVPFRDPNKGD